MAKKTYIRRTLTWQGRRYEVRAGTEAEAMHKLGILRAELESGRKTLGGETTVGEWFQLWLDTYKRPAGLTKKSLAMYTEKYDKHIGPKIGWMKLKDVKDVQLQEILNAQAGSSKSHASKVRLVLTEMFSRAHASLLIPHDPSAKLELPAVTEGTRRSITEEERNFILKVAETHRAGLLILTILWSGIRPGEAAALIWNDIDFRRNEIRIHKAQESGTSALKGPKTDAGHRDIPMLPQLRERLLRARGDPFDRVFLNARGDPMTEDAVQRAWRSFKREMDIQMGAKVYRNRIIKSVVAKDLTLYCLRHTFCTDLQRAGVPINVAKELMGHEDISVTANIYTHKDQDVLHSNMMKLAGVGSPTISDEPKPAAR